MKNVTPNIDHTAPFADRANAIINWAFGGEHHLEKEPIKQKYGHGERWDLRIHERDLSSYDYSQLTKLVICAHHYAVRVTIKAAGKELRVILFERDRNVDDIGGGHPPIGEPLKWFRKWNAGEVDR